MRVGGVAYRTIRVAEDGFTVEIIDQTRLPARVRVVALRTLDDAARAIRTMQVRGAPLIGVAAAYGVCLALRADPSDAALERACAALLATRPTAVNLRWALERCARRSPAWRRPRARRPRTPRPRRWPTRTSRCAARSASTARAAREAPRRGRATLQVLTHCNAGWLAAVDWGTALAPIYAAHERGAARCTSGSTRRGRATRARASPRGSSGSTASRTP